MKITLLTNKQKYPLISYVAAMLLLVALIGIVVNCQHTADYRVLVIHSYDKNFPNYPEFNRLIESEFKRQGEPVNVTYRYLDCERRNHPQEVEFMNDVIHGIRPGEEPDLIIPVGDQATYSLLVTHDSLIHHTPIMFLGVEFPNELLYARYDNLTGLTDSLAVLENLEIVRELIGKRHIFTMMEMRVLDKRMLAECNRQLDTVPYVFNNLEWKHTMWTTRNTPDSMLTLTSLSIRSGQANSAMKNADEQARNALSDENFFFMMRSDQPFYYLQLKADGFSNTMLNFTNKEQFTATYHYFGTNQGGFLAGYFASMQLQAADCAATAIRILRGEKPGNIPIRNCRKGYYIDWQHYKELGIPIDSVPKKYELVGADFKDFHPNIYHWIYSIVGIIVITIFAYLIYIILREQRHKRLIIEQSLEERKMFKLALQNSKAFAWRQRGDEITLEEEFWRYAGQQPHLINTSDFMSYIDPEMRDAFRGVLKNMTRGEEAVCEVRCDFVGNGAYEWWQIRTNNLMHTNRSNINSNNNFGLLINIELIKQREQELIDARKLAEQAELKESFLANMSHEIRTPLNAIVGFSNILATPGMELDDADKEEMMETINKNNDLLLKLINDVLDLSRIESGNIIISMEPCSVNKVMEYIYQSYSVQAPKHLAFEMVRGEAGLTISADEGRIEQVLTNFLTNAAKFTPEGYIHLGWKAHHQKRQVELYVEDSGIGLTPEQQLMIFDRFYKVNEFRQGTGLGLSICKVIAAKMKGRITVQSAPDQGSRFSLWLRMSDEAE